MSSIYPLVAALLANVIAQVLKPIVLYFRTKELDVHQCIACGGFPSSHSSTVTALTIAIGMNEGFDSALFAITCVFSFIVIYDAANVRYYAGRNIQLTKQLISDLETLKGLKFNDPIYHTWRYPAGHTGIPVHVSAYPLEKEGIGCRLR